MIPDSKDLSDDSGLIARDFIHVHTWVFDLDNTLYHPSARLFDQIEARMNVWMTRQLSIGLDEAQRLRHQYWAQYGTTLAGLMTEHRIDPTEFLDHVHDIDMDHLTVDPRLVAGIQALPGRKIVYTNADIRYAAKVLRARGLSDLFDAVYGVEEAGLLPKPQPEAFRRIFAADGLDPARAAMFEDDPRNLAAPHQMGMRTVLVGENTAPADHIHHLTDDLAGFLARVIR